MIPAPATTWILDAGSCLQTWTFQAYESFLRFLYLYLFITLLMHNLVLCLRTGKLSHLLTLYEQDKCLIFHLSSSIRVNEQEVWCLLSPENWMVSDNKAWATSRHRSWVSLERKRGEPTENTSCLRCSRVIQDFARSRVSSLSILSAVLLSFIQETVRWLARMCRQDGTPLSGFLEELCVWSVTASSDWSARALKLPNLEKDLLYTRFNFLSRDTL